MSLILGFYSCRVAAVTVSRWSNGQDGRTQPQTSHFEPLEGFF